MAATTEENRARKREGVHSLVYLELVADRIKRWKEQATKQGGRRWQARERPPYSHRSLAHRSLSTVLSWNANDYPGFQNGMAHVCGITRSTAAGWLWKNKPLPAHHALRIADWIEARIGPMEAAIRELRAYAAERQAAGLRKGNGRYHAALRAANPTSANRPID